MSTASTSTVPNPESSSSLSGKNGKATTTILVPTPTPTPTPAPPPPSLERKFELLEARFTQPLGLFGHQATHSISPTGNHHQQQQQQHQQNDQHSDGSEHSFRFSGNNNNNSSNNNSNNSNSNSNSSSNRSRGTMTVRSKRNSSGSLRQMTSLDMVHRAAAEHMRKVASSSPLLGLPGSSTLSVVATHANATLAHAHAHANAPSTTSPSPTASPASNFSLSGSPNNSQQTVVTGNRTHQRGGTTTSASSVAATATPPRQQSNTDNNNNNNNNNTETNDAERVVAESPPVLISPAKASTATTTTTATATARTKPSVARALPISQTQPKPGSGSATKRKSVPKRKISSINDTLLGQATSPIKPIAHNNNNTTTTNNNNNNHNNTAAATASRSPRPNHNSNHNHNHNNNNHNNNNNHSTNLFSEHSRDRSNNSNIGGGGGSNNHHNKKPRILLPPANNKRIHDFFSSTTKKKVLSSSSLAATGSSSSLNANTANANTNANANTTTTHHPPAPSVAPINHNKTGTSGNTGKTTNTNTKNSAPNTTAAATNNTAASVAATTATTTVVHPQPLVSSRRGRAGSASTTTATATATATSTATASTSIAPATTPSPSPAADQAALLRTAHAKTEHWQSKCAKLQQQLQDTNEQLRAVTGNKTILHTALQQALTKTRTELVTLRETTAARTQKLHSVLEDALRWRFENEAKELREALGADGNRLGRIVSTRAGMRVIDTWEEGHAARDWQLRREKWRRKRTALLAKQDALRKRLDAQKLKQIMQAQHGQQAQQARNQAEGDAPTTTGAPSPSSATTTATTTSATPVDDDPPLTDLEIEEAKESIQMHIEALLREEKELLAEEQTLNDEKGAHIRALKRVASEDASRFKNRAKLHDRYVPDRLLGKGGFSEVWKAYDLQELREVAVKIHQLDPRWPDVKKENYTKHVSREYEIHRNVRHPRIVSLYDVFEIDNNSFATVLECCHGTDLDTLLKRKKRLPERQARAILLQILSGMRYLSQPAPDGSRQGIIHYDLKPGNILFDEFGDAKITDFGLSKIVDTPDPAESMELTSQGAGTYWYLPPECFVTGEQVRISNKVDVWSIGVIFYQMLYGQRPFGEGKSQDKLLADHTMLNAQEVHLPDKPAVSDAGKEFVQQCLVYDQAFRPTIAQLCDHPYALQSGV